MKIKLSALKNGFLICFFIICFNTAKADSTSVIFCDLRLSIAPKGYFKKASDTTVQSSFAIENTFYYKLKHIGLGFGTGINNSKYYLSDLKSSKRVYQAPLFFSIKFRSTDSKVHIFENFGLNIPVISTLQNISTGYYFQSGFGIGYPQFKAEISYKVLTLTRDKGPLINNNITLGLCFTIN
jgi:hypothetical protein